MREVHPAEGKREEEPGSEAGEEEVVAASTEDGMYYGATNAA